MMMRTGWRALRASATAAGSMVGESLPPKPPPISVGMTRTLVMGICRIWAMAARNGNWAWVGTHTVALPEASKRASAVWGSM